MCIKRLFTIHSICVNGFAKIASRLYTIGCLLAHVILTAPPIVQGTRDTNPTSFAYNKLSISCSVGGKIKRTDCLMASRISYHMNKLIVVSICRGHATESLIAPVRFAAPYMIQSASLPIKDGQLNR